MPENRSESEKEVAKDKLEEAIYYHNYKEMKVELRELEKLEDIPKFQIPKFPSSQVPKFPSSQVLKFLSS